MTLRGHPARVFAVAFSPDGRRLASACCGREHMAVGSGDGQGRPEPAGTLSRGQTVAFSPDGRKLLPRRRNLVKFWDATPMTPELRVDAKPGE